MADEEIPGVDQPIEVHLHRIAREMTMVRRLLTEVVSSIRDAESEIPEKMRRFMMYMHDVHDVMWMYQEIGQEPPEYVKAEARRCDDRYRQLLQELRLDGGAFEKVRREMSKDPMNRWQHHHHLPAPKETK